MHKNFIRNIENFTCEKCGYQVTGDGYTDHCPKCLYGKHVDANLPGDRQSSCHGMLRPTGIRIKEQKQQIQYTCETCGKVSYCKIAKEDNYEIIISLSQHAV